MSNPLSSYLCPIFFIGFIFSDSHFGCHLDRYPLDGMLNFPVFPVGLSYLTFTNLDRSGYSRPGIALPLIFHLLHVNRNNAGIAGAHCPDDDQARPLGRNFRYGNPHFIPPEFIIHCVHTHPFTGGVEVAASVIVCNMPVIIPAVLRALGVGDPFMREDTVDPNYSTVEIVRMASTKIELGLPSTHGTATTDITDPGGAIGTVASRRGGTVDLDAKEDCKHRLVTQTSDGSLGILKKAKVVSLVDECDITDPLAQVRSLPTVRRDQDIEADVGGRHVKRNST